MEEGEEVGVSAVEAGGDAAKVFELVKAAFDAVAGAIEEAVVRDRHLAVGLGRNDGGHAPDGEEGAQSVAVIGFVGDETAALDPGQQDRGTGDVGGLARSQPQAQRTPQAIAEQVNLGGQASSGTPQSLVAGPPFPVAACWWALTRVASSRR